MVGLNAIPPDTILDVRRCGFQTRPGTIWTKIPSGMNPLTMEKIYELQIAISDQINPQPGQLFLQSRGGESIQFVPPAGVIC